MKEILTASRITTLLACHRKHYWRYEIGLRRENEAQYFRFGTAWHLAIEAYHRKFSYEDALAAACPEHLQLDEWQVSSLAALLSGYYRQWVTQEWIASMHPEIEFRHPIKDSRTFEAAGKIDGLGVLADTRHVLIEHKTTSEDISPASDYWLRVRANVQLYQYVLAARALGWQIEVVIYDVLRKPTIRPCAIPLLDDQGLKIVTDAYGKRVYLKSGGPKQSASKEAGEKLATRTEAPDEFAARLIKDTGERPDFYYARREVPILDQDLEEFEIQRVMVSRTILYHRAVERKVARREQAWSRNVTHSCDQCEFASFCLQNISVDPAQPPAGFTIGGANSELTQQ